jgi:ABC-type multidrug transport system fused ATPase/permease subunit
MTNQSIKLLWAHLAPKRKKQLAFLCLIMIFTSCLEVISIGAIVPFLTAIFSPEKLFGNTDLKLLFDTLRITSPNEILLPLALMFIFAAFLSAGMRLLLLWAQVRLGHAVGADLSFEIYEKTLYQPYLTHISRSSSQIISGITSQINTVVGQVIMPLLSLMSASLILIGILVPLLIIANYLTIILLLAFISIYTLIIFTFRKQLLQNSQRVNIESRRIIRALQEGLGAIRDILIDGTQNVYSKIYQSSDLQLRRALASNQIISDSPRFLIEALGITLITGLAYVLTKHEGGVSEAIPLLGALALGAQRLLPILQQLYGSWSRLRGSQASLTEVLELVGQALPLHRKNHVATPMKFLNSIKLDCVSFRYSDAEPWVLRNINLEISKGSCIGFVGKSGSGKSTLLDIIMSLLSPQTGYVLVDDIPLDVRNISSWRARISHVPQTIFLADATITENIALGVPIEQINFNQIKKAAQQAQLSETIEGWERGYTTIVGERGVRLSGGQRQRIGIARAMYKKSDVIILDEATSALDSNTEVEIMKVINSLQGDITICIAAHRVSTLKNCDYVIEIDGGKITQQIARRAIVSLDN